MNQELPPDTIACAAAQSDQDFFSKNGPLPTTFDDARRFPRFYYRSQVAATIHPLPGIEGASPLACNLLTRDLSRGGINLLHTQQLFPGQQIDLVLADGVLRSVEVVWCRRLAPRCWSAGCRFIRPDTEASASG
jgi:hypothetical protein